MKYLIFSNLEYLDTYLNFYLKKFSALIIYTQELKEIKDFEPDRVLVLSNTFGEKEKAIQRECQENNVFYVLFSDVSISNDYPLSFYLKDKNDIIDKMFEEKIIPEKFNYTDLHQAMPKMLDFVHRKKSGHFNVFNPGFVRAQTVFNYYDYQEAKTSDSFVIKPSSEFELEDISQQFIEDKKVVNVYMPTYYRLEKTKKSVLSILELVQTSKHDMKLYLGDNNTKLEEMISWLKSLPCEVVLLKENKGKAHAVNHLHRQARKCDYIFSIDSDMYYEEREGKKYHTLDKMIDVLDRGKNIGLVSSHQYDCSQHWFGSTVSKVKERGEEIGITSNGVGVAGGCVLLRCDDWEKIGMYKEDHDIYTGDDGILTYNVIRKLLKRPVVSANYYLVHPFPSEDEKGYVEWKGKSWQRDQLSFIKDNFKGKNQKGYYD